MGEGEGKILKKNWIRGETSKRGISIMWKCGGRTGLRLSRRLKCSLK
jgi:hypothetical protein